MCKNEYTYTQIVYDYLKAKVINIIIKAVLAEANNAILSLFTTQI